MMLRNPRPSGALPAQFEPRRGGATLEVSLAAVLATLTLTAVAQVSVAVGRQQARQALQALALEEAANTLEQLAGVPWNELDARVAEAGLSPAAAARMPFAELRATTSEMEGVPAARRVVVEIVPRKATELSFAPVRVVAWRHKARKPTP